MPKAPTVIGNLAESILGRSGRVRNLTEPAAGFIEVELDADPPRGGWQPGHETQFRVDKTLGRRYTVSSVSEDGRTIRILAATDAAGPGTTWIRRLEVGSEVALLAGPHLPLRQHGSHRLYLGDSSALGTIAACVGTATSAVAVLEVPTEAVSPLVARWPSYRFVPRADRPGNALQAWLESHLGTLAHIDGAVLLGHAQSLQRQRRALIGQLLLARRAITTKPYWATGRQGL